MNKALLQLVEIQGEIKIRLMKSGLPQEKAHELAGELVDYIARSPVTTEEHRQAYSALG